MPERIIAVFHSREPDPGKVEECLVARGFELDRRRPCHGGTLPEDLAGYAAAIVFGGPQSANDDHDPGIRAELDWIERAALPSGKPVLGICLGAQQIARVLGARVGPHPDGMVEIGYYEVRPTGRCPRFLAAPTMFYQWHQETFEVPRDAVHLAENALFPGQAFRYRGERVRHRVPPRDDAGHDRVVVRPGGFAGEIEPSQRAGPRRPSRRICPARGHERSVARRVPRSVPGIGLNAGTSSWAPVRIAGQSHGKPHAGVSGALR